MATFTATIHLIEATKQDYEDLFSKLEKHDLKSKWHIVKGRQFVDGKSEYKWSGNISLQEITSAILRSVSGMGQKYSFTIIRRKVAV
jgi:hypothetical protein